MLWLRAWFERRERKQPVKAAHTMNSLAFLTPVFDTNASNEDKDTFVAFFAQMDILLPLCLKSLILRCHQTFPSANIRTARVILDDEHMAVLDPFVEILARGMMGQALAGSGFSDAENGLLKAMTMVDDVLEFLIGLFAVVHPAHMSALLSKYFVTLRDCETEHLDTSADDFTFEWTQESLSRVRCSRQLRIRAIEKLSVLPNFIALNYPLRYTDGQSTDRTKKATWTMQYSNVKPDDTPPRSEIKDEWLPRSGWLAELLTSESLSICALSCEAVVAEAMAQIHQDSPKVSSAKASALKNRPTASLKRKDLLMFQSIAIHSITCVHELLLRRHAMDKRFQTEKSRGRIAALFAKPIFDKSLASVRWLARMESTHKVRSLWLLSFVYILQEAPETLIRDSVSAYSNPKVRIGCRFIMRLYRSAKPIKLSFIPRMSAYIASFGFFG